MNWTKANKSMSKILRGRVMFSSTTEKLFGNREYSHLLDCVIHAFIQEEDKVKVTAELHFLGDKGKKVIEFSTVVIV